MKARTLKKLTTLLVVDAIEPCLPTWKKLGYDVRDRVPDEGPLAFVILGGSAGNLMMQTRASLADDLPGVAKLRPQHLLYADVESLTEAKKSVRGARVIVARRKTFYGALEAWVELPGGTVMGLAEHTGR